MMHLCMLLFSEKMTVFWKQKCSYKGTDIQKIWLHCNYNCTLHYRYQQNICFIFMCNSRVSLIKDRHNWDRHFCCRSQTKHYATVNVIIFYRHSFATVNIIINVYPFSNHNSLNFKTLITKIYISEFLHIPFTCII